MDLVRRYDRSMRELDELAVTARGWHRRPAADKARMRERKRQPRFCSDDADEITSRA